MTMENVKIENFEMAVVMTGDTGTANVGRDGKFPPEIELEEVLSPRGAMVACVFLAQIVLACSDWTSEMLLEYISENIKEFEVPEIEPEDTGEVL